MESTLLKTPLIIITNSMHYCTANLIRVDE